MFELNSLLYSFKKIHLPNCRSVFSGCIFSIRTMAMLRGTVVLTNWENNKCLLRPVGKLEKKTELILKSILTYSINTYILEDKTKR